MIKLEKACGKFITPRQGKSYFMIKQCDTDLIIYLYYDKIDWKDWCDIRRN